jgi:hypothetical protein
MSSAIEMQASGQNLERGNQMKTKQLRKRESGLGGVYVGYITHGGDETAHLERQKRSRVNGTDKHALLGFAKRPLGCVSGCCISTRWHWGNSRLPVGNSPFIESKSCSSAGSATYFSHNLYL